MLERGSVMSIQKTMTVAQWICYLNTKVSNLEKENVSFLYGEEVPKKEWGLDGDYYLRFVGGILYKKISNSWAIQGDLMETNIDGGGF